MAETQRQNKVGRLIQKELSAMFQRECLSYCGGKMLSITKVRMSPDLSIAKVYVSIFPTSNKEEVIEGLNKGTKELRFNLGKRIGKQVRIIPTLRFYLDDSLDYIENIDNLLK
ncbi:30S ribosome-binding factor RbfA [Marinilabiliaceae bacterium JC040]|nr:30S ribosome-binding factor RbfA [Marinilabiliaceae bacterium JC040]